MSTSENPFANEMPSESKDAAAAGPLLTSLRWWPAAGLLAVIGALKAVPMVMAAPPIPLLMASFIGPAVVCLLIMLWWLFASRAPVKEKVAGLIGVVGLGVITSLLLHFSMKGMSTVLYLIPGGVGLFGLMLTLFAHQPQRRLQVALAFSAVGFGVWDFLQLRGVTGKFDPEFAWRWSPTPEEEYLKDLADRKPATAGDGSGAASGTGDSDNEVITRSTSQWSDFRGPQRDSKVPGVTLNEDWNSSPPRLVWRTKIGPGWSSFTVSGNRLFTQEQRGDNEAVVCLNAETGSILWTHEYPSRFWESVAGAGPRATPTIGDEGLFTLGANGHLFCLDPVSGEVRWKRDLQSDSGLKPPQWGFSSSPLVQDGLVIVHAGEGAGSGAVVAYDAKTGDVRWNVPCGGHSYCSPHPVTLDGVQGILMSTNNGLLFLAFDDGKVIWNHEWVVENYRAIQPLVIGNTILIGTSLGVGTRSITVKHEADAWTITEDWTTRDIKPDFNDFVEHQGYLYGFDGNIFSCTSLATGKRQWKKGRYGNGQVLLLPDAGQLLVTSESGELILIEADPANLVELAKIPAIEGKTWNHPVLIGNRLYVRNGEEAACYELATSSIPD